MTVIPREEKKEYDHLFSCVIVRKVVNRLGWTGQLCTLCRDFTTPCVHCSIRGAKVTHLSFYIRRCAVHL